MKNDYFESYRYHWPRVSVGNADLCSPFVLLLILIVPKWWFSNSSMYQNHLEVMVGPTSKYSVSKTLVCNLSSQMQLLLVVWEPHFRRTTDLEIEFKFSLDPGKLIFHLMWIMLFSMCEDMGRKGRNLTWLINCHAVGIFRV